MAKAHDPNITVCGKHFLIFFVIFAVGFLLGYVSAGGFTPKGDLVGESIYGISMPSFGSIISQAIPSFYYANANEGESEPPPGTEPWPFPLPEGSGEYFYKQVIVTTDEFDLKGCINPDSILLKSRIKTCFMCTKSTSQWSPTAWPCNNMISTSGGQGPDGEPDSFQITSMAYAVSRHKEETCDGKVPVGKWLCYKRVISYT